MAHVVQRSFTVPGSRSKDRGDLGLGPTGRDDLARREEVGGVLKSGDELRRRPLATADDALTLRGRQGPLPRLALLCGAQRRARS